MEVARREFKFLAELLSALGLHESLSKAVGPGTSVVLRGISFDTVKMTMEVTPDRVQEILVLADSWLGKKSASKREVQQLVGKLVFTCKCVRQGRIFLNRLLQFLRSFVGSEI